MESTPEAKPEPKRLARFSLSVPPRQQAALEDLVNTTGLSKNELIRQAIGLLTIAVTARERGLILALANDQDEVLTHIVSSV